MAVRRISDEPAFVLHSYAWSESSLILEVFTRHHGRVALVAKGAKKPTSNFRPVLLPLQPLHLAYTVAAAGAAEIHALKGAEWVGGHVMPTGDALLSGLYLNELLLRLLARGDAHEVLYDRYVDTLDQLAGESTIDFERILRRFEKSLLSEIGYGATFDVDAESGVAIDPNARYVFQPERGAMRAAGQPGCPVSGRTLLDLAEDRFDRPATLAEAKMLMRALINHTLGTKPLYTRQLLRELTDLNP